jgi:hypothetical protein
MSKIKTEILLTIQDPSGKIIKRYPWKKTHSLLKQFLQMLAVHLSLTTLTVKDTGGTDRSVSATSSNFAILRLLADTAYGILIGTGETPVAMTDLKLETQVSTNIIHGAMTVAVDNPDANTWRVSFTRPFTNQTGATLNIKELAIYGYASGTGATICLERTLYSAAIANSTAFTFVWRLSISL